MRRPQNGWTICLYIWKVLYRSVNLEQNFMASHRKVTYLRTSLSEGKAAAISSRILSMCSFDINGYGAVEICNPSIGIMSCLITSCSLVPVAWPALVSSLKKAAILFWPRYRDSLGSSSSKVASVNSQNQETFSNYGSRENSLRVCSRIRVDACPRRVKW